MTDSKWLDYVDRVVYWLQRHESAAFFLFISLVVVVYGLVKWRPLIVATGVGVALFGLYEERYGPDFGEEEGDTDE